MIKAIETRYKGYRFRSRLEARWAVFFDALGLQWEYEPEGFDLGEAGWYLPDFYLPEVSSWIEIKGGKATDGELEKCRRLFEGLSGKSVATDVLATGCPKLTAGVVKSFSDQFEKSPVSFFGEDGKEVSTGDAIAAFLKECMESDIKRNHVFCMEGLLENGWMCLDDFAIQVSPENVIYQSLGLLAYSQGMTKSSLSKARRSKIGRAFNKARAARFEHGEKP